MMNKEHKFMKKIIYSLTTIVSLFCIFILASKTVSADSLDEILLEENLYENEGVIVRERIFNTEELEAYIENNEDLDFSLEDKQLNNLKQYSRNNVFDMNPFGVAPPLDVWNVISNGSYSFSGTHLSGNALYTNYLFEGRRVYNVIVSNRGTGLEGVEARRNFALRYYSGTLEPNRTIALNIETPNTSRRFYLMFYSVASPLQNGSITGSIY